MNIKSLEQWRITPRNRAVNETNKQVYSVGCEFVDLRSESQEEIKRYVAQYSVNIVYVLSLFEQGLNKEDIKPHQKMSFTDGL